MNFLNLTIFINDNNNISISQKAERYDCIDLVEITPDMVDIVCNELQGLKKEIEALESIDKK